MGTGREMVADDPANKIDLKAFHCQIINDHKAISSEERSYRDLPPVRRLSQDEVTSNYERIKRDIKSLIDRVCYQKGDS